MAKSEVVNGLLKQAGVTVLAGLLMSSVVMAEGAANDAGNVTGGAEMSVDVSVEDQEAMAVEAAGEGAEDGTDVSTDEGFEPEVTECGFEFELPEVTVEWSTDEAPTEEWPSVDPIVDPYYEVEQVPECAECEANPELAIEPVEFLGLPEMLQMDAGIASAAEVLNDGAAPRATAQHEGGDRPKLWLSRQLTN